MTDDDLRSRLGHGSRRDLLTLATTATAAALVGSIVGTIDADSEDSAAAEAAPLPGLTAASDRAYLSRAATFDPLLYGARGDGSTDDSAAFQAAINAAGAVRGRVAVVAGNYVLDQIIIPNLVKVQGAGGDIARYAGGTSGGVNLIHASSSSRSMIVVDGNGTALESLSLLGNGSTAPLLEFVNGFESRVERVQLAHVAGTALLVDRANNTTWNDIFVNSCGSATAAAVVIKSPRGVDAQTNTVTCNNLTIETSPGPALDIAFGTSSDFFAEFVRIDNLHIEFDPSSPPAKAGPNTGLVRVGNVRHLELVSPFLYGGPGPLLVQRRQSTFSPSLMDGVRLIGGALLGSAASDAGGATEYLVDLISGDDFAAVGTRFGGFSLAAVRAEKGYGARVAFDPTCSCPDNTKARLFADHRSITVPTPSVTLLPANGTSAPKPTISGSDARGTVLFGVGTKPSAGPQVRVTFATPRASAPVVTVTPTTFDGANFGYYVRTSPTAFEIDFSRVALLSQSTKATPAGQKLGFAYSVTE